MRPGGEPASPPTESSAPPRPVVFTSLPCHVFLFLPPVPNTRARELSSSWGEQWRMFLLVRCRPFSFAWVTFVLQRWPSLCRWIFLCGFWVPRRSWEGLLYPRGLPQFFFCSRCAFIFGCGKRGRLWDQFGWKWDGQIHLRAFLFPPTVLLRLRSGPRASGPMASCVRLLNPVGFQGCSWVFHRSLSLPETHLLTLVSRSQMF